MMTKTKWTSLVALLVFGQSLQAEIEQITIHWNALKCLNTCVPLIERSLQSVQHVSNIQIDSQTGTAIMAWDSNYPFSYEPFKTASATVGIRFNEISLRVKGTIHHETDQFYLTSSKDGSRFLLTAPMLQQPGHSTPRFNTSIRPLAGEAKNQLLEAEKNQLIVEISGPLFLARNNPLILIAEHIKLYVPTSK